MSLDKAVKSGKEKRKPFAKSEEFDKTCRSHGSCNYCRSNRTHRYAKQALTIREVESEWD